MTEVGKSDEFTYFDCSLIIIKSLHRRSPGVQTSNSASQLISFFSFASCEVVVVVTPSIQAKMKAQLNNVNEMKEKRRKIFFFLIIIMMSFIVSSNDILLKQPWMYGI